MMKAMRRSTKARIECVPLDFHHSVVGDCNRADSGKRMRSQMGKKETEGFAVLSFLSFEIRDVFVDCGKRTNREGEVGEAGERNDQ